MTLITGKENNGINTSRSDIADRIKAYSDTGTGHSRINRNPESESALEEVAFETIDYAGKKIEVRYSTDDPVAMKEELLNVMDRINSLDLDDQTSLDNFLNSGYYNDFREKYGIEDRSFENKNLLLNFLCQIMTEIDINSYDDGIKNAEEEKERLDKEIGYSNDNCNRAIEEYDSRSQEIINTCGDNLIAEWTGELNIGYNWANGYSLDDDELEYWTNILYACFQKDPFASRKMASSLELSSTYLSKEDVKYILENYSGDQGMYYTLNEMFYDVTNDKDKLAKIVIANDSRYQEEIKTLKDNINSVWLSDTPINDIDKLKKAFETNQPIFEFYDVMISSCSNESDAAKRQLSQLQYEAISYTSDYNNFDFKAHQGIELDLESLPQPEEDNNRLYRWDESIGLSPLDFILNIMDAHEDWDTNTDNILETGMINKYIEMHTGSTSEKGDYLHDDTYDIINLIAASKYNPGLIDMYNYLYYTQGLQAANEYIWATRQNARQTLAMVEVQKSMESLGVSGDTATIKVYDPDIGQEKEISFKLGDASRGEMFMEGFGNGVADWGTGMLSWANADTERSVSEWEQYYFNMMLMSTEDKISMGLIDSNGNSTSEFLDFSVDYSNGGKSEKAYGLGNTFGGMVPNIIMNQINPVWGTMTMFLSSGGRKFRSGVLAGEDAIDSYLYAILSTGGEVVLEKVMGAIPGIGQFGKDKLPTVTLWLKKVAMDGGKAAFQESLDIALRYALFDEEINFNEFINRVGTSVVYEMIMSGVMNGVKMVIEKGSIDATIKDFMDKNNGELSYEQMAEVLSRVTGKKVTVDYLQGFEVKGLSAGAAIDAPIDVAFVPTGESDTPPDTGKNYPNSDPTIKPSDDVDIILDEPDTPPDTGKNYPNSDPTIKPSDDVDIILDEPDTPPDTGKNYPDSKNYPNSDPTIKPSDDVDIILDEPSSKNNPKSEQSDKDGGGLSDIVEEVVDGLSDEVKDDIEEDSSDSAGQNVSLPVGEKGVDDFIKKGVESFTEGVEVATQGAKEKIDSSLGKETGSSPAITAQSDNGINSGNTFDPPAKNGRYNDGATSGFDFDEFYKLENGKVNKGYGIGAQTLISPDKSVTVANATAKDSVTGEDVLGLGSHYEAKNRIAQEMYGLPSKITTDNGMPSFTPEATAIGEQYDNVFDNSIEIRHVNEGDTPYMSIEVPEHINDFQISELEKLNSKLKSMNTNVDVSFRIKGHDVDDVFEQVNGFDEGLEYIKSNHN